MRLARFRALWPRKRTAGAPRARRPAISAPEPLENRQLLTRAYPIPLVPPNVRNVPFEQGLYTLRIDGPGLLRVRPSGRDGYAVTLLGTTEQSVLRVGPKSPPPILEALGVSNWSQGPHASGNPLPIASISVRTGRLGGIDARASGALRGTLSPLNGSVGFLRFAELGPNARIDVNGSLGELGASRITLGPAGRVNINGPLLGALEVNDLELAGGQIIASRDLGRARIGQLDVRNSGRIAVGNDVTHGFHVTRDAELALGGTITIGNDLNGQLAVQGHLGLAPDGQIEVRNDLDSLFVAQDLDIDGGRIVVRNDLGSLVVTETARIRSDGELRIGRDLTRGIAVGGNLALDGGRLRIARDLVGPTGIGGNVELVNVSTWSIGRDLRTPIVIEGNLVIGLGSALDIGRNSAGVIVKGKTIDENP